MSSKPAPEPMERDSRGIETYPMSTGPTSCLPDPLPVGLSVHQWGTEEVGAWLGFLSLNEYQDIFMGHDVRGAELIHLERRDLKVLLLPASR